MIVHLLGFPGVGKYSVAAALTRLAGDVGSVIVLVDNHLSSNVVLSVIDADGVADLPDDVWDRVGEIREVLYTTIEETSPPDWSFVSSTSWPAASRHPKELSGTSGSTRSP